MIRIKENLKEPTVDIWYSPEEGKNEYVGKCTNNVQFTDLRVQIKQEQVEGYSVYYKGQQIKINRRGKLEDYPAGLYDQVTDLLIQLI